MKTQNDTVLAALKRMTLTQAEAAIELGIWRLSARIFDLRSMGYNIKTHWVGKGNKRYARYRLQHGNGTG